MCEDARATRFVTYNATFGLLFQWLWPALVPAMHPSASLWCLTVQNPLN